MGKFKLIIHVPIKNTEEVRTALGNVGAGKIGNYDFCSFTYRGVGRFRGNEKSNPAIGKKEKIEEVEEDVVEFVLEGENLLLKVIEELKKVHPYEEPAFEVIRLENY